MKTETKTTTRTIAGHEITLEAGTRYWAGRPIAFRGKTEFTVSIYHADDVLGSISVWQIPRLTYDQANEFLAAFNDGPTSFEGRVWE